MTYRTTQRRITITARAVALMMCLPLFGGRVTAFIIDAIIYPDGACCCVRSHGEAHRCRCALPPEADESDAAAVTENCARWEQGGEEPATPELISLHPVIAALPRSLPAPSISGFATIWTYRIGPPDECSPPPVPPPIAAALAAQV